MEVENNTTNKDVVYEAQDGGGPGGPAARLLLAKLDDPPHPEFDIRNDVHQVHNQQGVAGSVPAKSTVEIQFVLQHPSINLVFWECQGNTFSELCLERDIDITKRYTLGRDVDGEYTVRSS